MTIDRFAEIRKDCIEASLKQPDVRNALGLQHISVTGGTGFLGSWIAEMVAALNDEYKLGITLDLYARNTQEWANKYPHLAGRKEIKLISQDVRSPFEFDRKTNFVVHAAGLPNNRVHSSDPLRVYQTTVIGVSNVLEAATQLDNLTRFLNVSSCLVSGSPDRRGPLRETDFFPIPCGQLHTVYADAKRAAENLAAIFRSQFRMPISTIRPFTFAGPYQELDRPWALNNFLRDALTGNVIRIHGDGDEKRSYLYGSDAAWWTLAALVNGQDGATYNVGSPEPVTLLELVNLIGNHSTPRPNVLLNTGVRNISRQYDLYPDIAVTQSDLKVMQTCTAERAIEKTWRWFNLSV